MVARKQLTAPTIADLLAKSAGFLKQKGSATPRLDAELLLAEVLGTGRIELYTNYDQPLNKVEVDRYRELIRRRATGEPVAYILGRAYFRNLTLMVDSSVLIPRPETEHVVEAALNVLLERDWSGAPRVLDAGTGSGAIAISIAAGFPEADVTAADASREALALAEKNARAAGAGRISFILSDLFESLDPTGTFDLIVSNPPYISAEEWAQLPPDVREFEPREALYGGADGLDFYRRIAVEAAQILRPRGVLVLETGYQQGPPVTGLLEASGSFAAAVTLKDYSGFDRVVVAARADSP